jgi:hypothetical protein
VIDDREKVGVRVIIKNGRYKLGRRWIEVRAHVCGGLHFGWNLVNVILISERLPITQGVLHHSC